jgi:hypothetical protein
MPPEDIRDIFVLSAYRIHGDLYILRILYAAFQATRVALAGDVFLVGGWSRLLV